jgi:predicted alpha/beta-fold hydrolase
MAIRELPFDPCPLLGHPHLQTVVPLFLTWHEEPVSETFKVPLEDGDQLSLEVTTPEGWQKTDPTVVCVHGFGGSHQSVYMVRLALKLPALKMRVVRFNMRGQGSGKGLAKKVFNMNFADDVLAAIRSLKALHPESPITVIGFSLGGNAVLRMMGNLGGNHEELVQKVISVAPPLDLALNPSLHHSLYPATSWILEWYDWYFYGVVKDSFQELSAMFKEIPPDLLPQKSTMHLFSQNYLAHAFGNGDVDHYFRQGSAIYAIDKIEVPCKILFAQDDPIVLHHLLDDRDLPSHIEVYKTEKGGHMGYLGNPLTSSGFYWLDSLLANWVLEKE